MSNPNLAALTEFNFIVAIDASGSMGESDMPGGRSRWNYMQETAVAFARDMEQIDSDGIGVVMFSGSNIDAFDGVTADKVKEIFASRSPRGGTPLAQALSSAIGLAKKSDKKAIIVVFTDGVPDDKEAAANVIRNQANSQETDDEMTILFVQVGRDAQASAYLLQLDDDLKGAKFDIVDAKTIDEAENFPTTADLVIHAIND